MKRVKIFIAFAFLLAFALQVSAQVNLFPNELKGYEFFAKGKLKDLKLGISTPKDIKDNFGENCENSCEYDENWMITFDFFSKNQTIEIGGKILTPKEDFHEKLYSVALVPRKNISFRKTKFPKYFSLIGYGGGGGCPDGDGECSWREDKLYKDEYGLIYSICEKSFPNKCKKGDLSAIIYSIPDTLEAKIFTEEK